MTVAVTGGSGRVGRYVIEELITHGYEVRNLDQRPPEERGQARFIRTELTDFGQVCNAVRGCGTIIHLAAIANPYDLPTTQIYMINTMANYNVLEAAATVGISKVCMASSVNAIGLSFSRQPRFDSFPIDERHPTYNEECYGLSKWVGEQQADSFARRYEEMTLASFRFHGITLPGSYAGWRSRRPYPPKKDQNLWSYTDVREAARACRLVIEATYKGHEVFFITGADTAHTDTSSLELAERFYPEVPVTCDLSGFTSFWNCAKARQWLGWTHERSWRKDD